MTIQEQEILDILSDKIYVLVEYDDTDAREYFRLANLSDLLSNIGEVNDMLKLKIISKRLTWDEAFNFYSGRSKSYIANYKTPNVPIIPGYPF